MIDFSPMDEKQGTPKVGVSVLLERNSKILMQLRKGSHRANTWELPGGHMDLGESFETTCKREIFEEIGIHIDSVDKIDFLNTIFKDDGLHYITLYFKAVWDTSQEPKIMEPEKIKELRWCDPNTPPSPIFSDNVKDIFVQFGRDIESLEIKLLKEIYWERG